MRQAGGVPLLPGFDPDEYVAFDLETTGLSPEKDRIVEIGAVRFDANGREIAEFQSLVNPLRPSSPGARAVHGIPDESLGLARTAEHVLPEFLEFLGDHSTTVLLAHNAAFDAGFLGKELARIGRDWPPFQVVDTLALSRTRRPDLRTHRLDAMCGHYGITLDDMHRALGDSRRVKALWLALQGMEGAGGMARPLLSYPIHDPTTEPTVPAGWETLAAAIAIGAKVRMVYKGGTRGATPREITPKRFDHVGGSAYVVALCHLDRIEKSFRLDRVESYDICDPITPLPSESGRG